MKARITRFILSLMPRRWQYWRDRALVAEQDNRDLRTQIRLIRKLLHHRERKPQFDADV